MADSRSISMVLALLPMPKASIHSCNAVSQLLTNHMCLLFAVHQMTDVFIFQHTLSTLDGVVAMTTW
jgi:hypothetical protein